jgi:transposase
MTKSGTETAIHTIGLDIANDSFSVHGFDVEGHMVVTKNLKRGQVLMWFAKLPPAR